MHSVDYRELALTNREKRIRHIQVLKAMVQANVYQVSAGEIADGIIDEAELVPVRRDHKTLN